MSGAHAARLRRLERQVAAFRDMHVRELSELAERLGAIARLHGDELDLILSEVRDLAAGIESAASGDPSAGADAPPRAAEGPSDPAARSPKRARWLAEQERRAHPTRRELLRGRRRDEAPPSA